MSAGGVRRELRRKADELGLEFQQALQYYAMERFLFRLSRSEFADRLVVKGAALLRVWDGAVARPTRDIDFLGRITNTPDAVESAIRECLSIESDDGLIFEDTVVTSPITIEDRYPGVRVKLRGDLSGARFVLRLDVGIDDAVVPDPAWVDYPTLLGGPAPRILAYRPATAVAEKLEAMVSLGAANSRMKDYYDIWMLATSIEFDGGDLSAAIAATFERRGTALPKEPPIGLTGDFANQDATKEMWGTFAGRLVLSGLPVPPSLYDAIAVILGFVWPATLAASADEDFEQRWEPDGGWR